MAYESFPWNSWIDSLEEGNSLLFFNGLRKAVFGCGFFKGKTDAEIYQQFGEINQEDILQIIWLELVERGTIYSYQDEGLTDEEIATRIVVRIKSRIIDSARKRLRRASTFGSSAEDEPLENMPDYRPSPEDDLINQDLINLVKNRLTSRQLIILNDYERFGIGDKQREEIAKSLNLSIQMIDKEIAKIKMTLREIAQSWRIQTKWNVG
jgi:hypothetical protein